MIWRASSKQTIYDLAIQLYGNVSFAYKIMQDNNLSWNHQTSTGEEIFYDTTNVDLGLQRQLVANRIIISTAFTNDAGIPAFIQRSFNNDFNLDFN